MQKGHFLSTKIKTIMMIKKTCAICAGMAARVGMRYIFFFTRQNATVVFVGICIQNHLHRCRLLRLMRRVTKKKRRLLMLVEKCCPGITDTYLTSQSRGPQPRSEQRGNTHGFNSTHPLTDADRYL